MTGASEAIGFGVPGGAIHMKYRCLVPLTFLVLAISAQNAIAQCNLNTLAVANTITDPPHLHTAPIEQHHADASSKRIVVLDLQLTNAGRVRAVQFLNGDASLRTAAIKAAATRRYEPRPGYKPNETIVAVEFPPGKNSPLRLRVQEVVVGGVRGCIYAGEAFRMTLPGFQTVPEWIVSIVSQPVQPRVDIPEH